MNRRQCISCGAIPGEAVFPPKVRGKPSKCTDCVAEASREAPGRRRPIIRRAAYRAALRVRQASLQLDLIDSLVPSP
jgi:hypothetical protein